ncbi:MAG: exosortase O [Timaviella obliquedivisa GSE-PSE-MK23-08B]|jgi:exosortase O|nr:exosortase O [Timaviella obliquedivisa GSE-PSE-MK23-08B]
MTENHWVRWNARPDYDRWQGILSTCAIAGSWLYLNRSVLDWLAQTLQEISVFNGLMLIAGGLLLLGLGIYYRQQIQFSALTLRALPLAIMLGCGIGAIATRWLIALEQLPVVLFVSGTYGMLGLFLAPVTWRKGLPVGVAIACLFPFGVQFSTGLGAPARVLTAYVVEFVLNLWHVPAISTEDIILLDTGVAYVDSPCSGLKSMWTGTLFLLAATWLENREMGLRWLVVGVANLGFLAIANTARIITLVVLTHVLHQPALAEMLHVPLGLMGFVIASLTTWGLLRWVPRQRSITDSKNVDAEEKQYQQKSHYSSLQAMLILMTSLLALTLIPHPQQTPSSTVDLSKLEWSTSIQTQPIALNPYEQKFFANYPGVTTQKQQFKFQNLTGSVVLVASPTWQAHHAPELCLTAVGYHIDQMIGKALTPAISARWLTLNGGQKTSTYWFQSATRTTDDFFVRFWGEVFRKDSTWTLVSLVFDQSHSADEPSVQAFLTLIHHALAQIQPVGEQS